MSQLDLFHLQEADIRTRCSEASFQRGGSYYAGGAVRQRLRLEDGIESRVSGTYSYRVAVRKRPNGMTATCSCPYDQGGDCKHIVATLLAWLHEPESFQVRTNLRVALTARSQEELVGVLADICAAYPHLVDEFALHGELAHFDAEAVVGAIFSDLRAPGGADIDEAVVRMEHMARQAVRLAQQGQAALARQLYFVLTRHCVEFCEEYGTHDIFPPNIPYDFAEAYGDLAQDQMDENGPAIVGEVRTMLGGNWAAEMLGVEEALFDLGNQLGLWESA